MPRFGLLLLALGSFATAGSGAAFAAAGVAVSVERGPGAESCPDTSELNALVEGMRGRKQEQSPSYRVLFERTASTFQASIVSATDGSERKLTDSGSTCQALGRAAAVTLALLLDAEPRAAADATAAPTANPEGEPLRPAEPSQPVTSQARPSGASALTIEAGGTLLAGVVRPIAPGLVAGAGLRSREVHVGLSGLWIVPMSIELAPGRVVTSFLGAKLDACFAAARAPFARLDLCSGLIAGYAHAEAHGFTRNDARSRPWLALPFELALRSEAAPFGWDAGVALLVPVRRQDFQVDGVGVAYRSPAVAGLFWLRAVGVIWH